MKATQPTPTELVYNEINIGKSKTVQYYELSKGDISKTPLTELLRISDNRNFAKSSPKYWLSIRGLKKWIDKPFLTGLFPTSSPGLYYGDHNKKESLIIFDFRTENSLKIKVYKGYYPNYTTIKALLNQF